MGGEEGGLMEIGDGWRFRYEIVGRFFSCLSLGMEILYSFEKV